MKNNYAIEGLTVILFMLVAGYLFLSMADGGINLVISLTVCLILLYASMLICRKLLRRVQASYERQQGERKH